jgi:hypothetical protein
MTSSMLHTISRKAQKILVRRGYTIVRSVTLRDRDARETLVCTRAGAGILHVRLVLCPNTLTTGSEVARYCNCAIHDLRLVMNSCPGPVHRYECWAVLPFGGFYPLAVLPDRLVDLRSGETVELLTAGSAPL